MKPKAHANRRLSATPWGDGMVILGYVGDHAKDTIAARAGWRLVRLAQIGATYCNVTHVEAHHGGPWYDCTIASSSLRDGGVRTKRGVELEPVNWVAIFVPGLSLADSIAWFAGHDGQGYAKLGATASALWFLPAEKNRKFCNEAVALPHGIVDAHRLTPAGFFAFMTSLDGAQDVTAEFFSPNQHERPNP